MIRYEGNEYQIESILGTVIAMKHELDGSLTYLVKHQ